MSYIDVCLRNFLDLWERRRGELEDNHDIQIFHRDAEQADTWISMREAILSSEDVGVSVGIRRWSEIVVGAKAKGSLLHM